MARAVKLGNKLTDQRLRPRRVAGETTNRDKEHGLEGAHCHRCDALSPHTAMLVAPSALQPAFGAAFDPNLARKATPYTFRDSLGQTVNLSSLNTSSA